MVVTFACPECGTPVALPPRAVGRQVRCPECLTLIEVPFLPRPSRSRRSSNARQWATVGIVLASGIIVCFGSYLFIRGRMRADRQRVFRELIVSAERDESAGRLEGAIERLRAAVRLGAEPGLLEAGELSVARDRLGRLTESRDQRTQEELIGKAEANIAAAETLAQDPRSNAARILDLCEEATRCAEQAATHAGGPILEQARRLFSDQVRRKGVVFAAVHGAFLDGPAGGAEYTRAMQPLFAQSLAAHGYLPERPDSRYGRLWNELAPYRVTIEIVEAHGPTYMQSKLRTTRIDARFEFLAGTHRLWQARLAARTREPAAGLSAIGSGYLASAAKQDPKLERRLYDDAFHAALDQLPSRLAGFPDWSDSSY